MAKNKRRKPKHKIQSHKRNLKKPNMVYLRRLDRILKYDNPDDSVSNYTNKFIHVAYLMRLKYAKYQFDDDINIDKELPNFDLDVKHNLNLQGYRIGDNLVSIDDLLIYYGFKLTSFYDTDKVAEKDETKEKEFLVQMMSSLSAPFMLSAILYSDIRKRILTVKLEVEQTKTVSIIPSANRLIPRISFRQPESKKVFINNRLRPVFRVPILLLTDYFQWLSIDAERLKFVYNGNKPQLAIYVQSHAIRRMKERLDYCDGIFYNRILYDSLSRNKELIFMKDRVLIPVFILEVKVGYFHCKIINDDLVVLTFLFITHSCTPEGERLKEIAHIDKFDVKYWQMDRLSSFLRINSDLHVRAVELFAKVGIDRLFELQEDFGVTENDYYSANHFNALFKHINRGKNFDSEFTEDLQELNENFKEEEVYYNVRGY